MNVSTDIHKYWKIILILSVIVLTVIFFVFSEKNITLYNTNDENFEVLQNIMNFKGLSYKVSILLNKDEFDKMVVPEGMSLYYFPEECPDYKEDTFLHTKENGLDKYYIPEKNYLILLNKLHVWTKAPDKIVMWKK